MFFFKKNLPRRVLVVEVHSRLRRHHRREDDEVGQWEVAVAVVLERFQVLVLVLISPVNQERGWCIRGQGGGEGGDTVRLTFPLVSPPPWGLSEGTQ